MPQLNPEGAETKRSPALGRGLAEGGVGLKVGLPGALSGSPALLPGRGVSSRRRRCCPCRVSHAGKWPPRSTRANRCLWPDAPLPGQMLLLEHRLRPELQSFLSLPSAPTVQLLDPQESCREHCVAEHRPQDRSGESFEGQPQPSLHDGETEAER